MKPEEVKGDDEKQGVAEKSEDGHGVFAARREAAAGHIEPPGKVESQRPEKDYQQADEKENAAPNPESEKETHTGDQLQPGYPEGGHIDRDVREKLIIVNRSGEKLRVKNLIQAGKDEDAAEDDPGRQSESRMDQQAECTGRVVRLCHGHVIPQLVSTVFASNL